MPKASSGVVTGLSSPPQPEERYHILSNKQKWNLVILVSFAGSFSPLSSNIYFPAVDTISRDLGVNRSLIALTITVYMVVQGIAPSLLGAFSDAYGRRLTFTITLTIYAVANLALAFTTNYPMLMVLRGLQAGGSAATISISAGVIADIACPQERGRFIGTNAGVRMTGQAIGPIIGGALNSLWGVRSIFWLLFILSVIVLGALLIFLPETQRSIAGNGTIVVSGFQKPFIYSIRTPLAWTNNSETSTFSPLAYILENDIAALLAWGAVAYTAWSMVTSSTTTMLLLSVPFLTQSQIGPCFLPNGLGCIFGSLSTGLILDQSFNRVLTRYKTEHGIAPEESVVHRRDFPYVRARLRLMPVFSIMLMTSLALYGPSFEFNDLLQRFGPNLVAPLILQFMIAFSVTAIFNINSTMLIDCFPERPASATALNNLCRCLLGAVGVSAIQPLIGAVRAMRAFFIVSGVVFFFTPLVWIEWKWGERWRQEREKRRAQRN
ncbi:hypothetical protein N7509_012776 [Penicillium cosmopolitanum]|uniref:Major facilitator superfamily (MFS) profile domain-containing protein n=1 Tax=Penicillium cosmopolitanum TaxID=1131564 RepID=A0A9W9SCK5_9EURO|nr:uncharacterized protein N7509_012776 [Penicillium cosmopolitanum]KAJ5375890.1 hypothetical protein N7509_012776 [Penicillium cosmopolitanum]